MEKINVKICMGTTCFVMGASNLQELTEILPEKFPGKIEVQGVTCFDFCSECSESQAPYVTIDGDIIKSATVEKVIEDIERRLKNG